MELRRVAQAVGRTAINSRLPLRLRPSPSFPARQLSTSSCLLAPPQSPRGPAIKFTKLDDSASTKPQLSTQSPGPPIFQNRARTWPVRELPSTPPPSNLKDLVGPSPFDTNPPSFDSSQWYTPDSAAFDLQHYLRKPKEKPLRLIPSTGRAVYVSGRVDQAQAFHRMEALVKRNHVKTEFQKQRFHERPGLRRKRLKGSRWKQRFKDGFYAAKSRVLALSEQGW